MPKIVAIELKKKRGRQLVAMPTHGEIITILYRNDKLVAYVKSSGQPIEPAEIYIFKTDEEMQFEESDVVYDYVNTIDVKGHVYHVWERTRHCR